MGGNGRAPGGSRHRNVTCLTATPSAAGRLPPPLHSVSSHLLDLYHECVDSGGWARVLYDARGGMEKFLFIRKIEPTPAPTVLAPLHKHGRPASDRRRARDKRRREAWAARRRNRSQSSLHTQAAEDDITPRRPAPAPRSLTFRTPHLHKPLSPLHLSWHRCHCRHRQSCPRQRRRRLHLRRYRHHRMFRQSQLPHQKTGKDLQ
jgi:hypothetical protein